jgi:RNA polymerase sigma-70 factor, ECF subfamily
VPFAGHDDDGAEHDPEEDRDEATRADRQEAELNRLAGMAAQGDKDALNRLLGLLRTPVVRYCRARMGDGIGLQTAEDVAQDVLIAVCGALGRYRPGETAAMAFVYGIARNKVVDAFRAAGRDHSEPTESIPDAASDWQGPEASAVLGTEVGELRDMLEKLPSAHREVLVLRIALQFSAEETARAVGSTAGAVRVTQHRAMAKLRGMMVELR